MTQLKSQLLALERKMSGSQDKKADIADKCRNSKEILNSLKTEIIHLKKRQDEIIKKRENLKKQIIDAQKEINKI